MLHACVQRFDVTKNLEKFCKILGTKQALSYTLELKELKPKVEAGCCECGRLCSKHVLILVWLVPRVMDGSADGYKTAHLCPPLRAWKHGVF